MRALRPDGVIHSAPPPGSPVPVPPSPWSSTDLKRPLIARLGLALLTISLGASLWFERYIPLLAVFAVLGLAAWVWPMLWWQRHRSLTVLAAVHVALVFGYLWSLDESVHVTIQATPHRYVAWIGDNRVALSVPHTAGDIALYNADLSQMSVGPAGEGHPLSSGPLLPLGTDMRSFGFQPAWANVRLGEGGRSQSLLPRLGASAPLNRRGELEPTPNSAVFASAAPATYTFSADLVRSDGVQGVVVGVNRFGVGYAFLIRMDAHFPIDPGDARLPANGLWYRWDNGALAPAPLARLSVKRVAVVPMIQRDVRILLNNFIVAWGLLLLAVPLYVLMAMLLRPFPRKSRGEGRSRLRAMATILAIATLVQIEITITATFSRYVIQLPRIVDSVAYLFQAKTYALGMLQAPSPKLPKFFSALFILHNHSHWFGKYPPGWPLLLAAGVKLGAAWLVNPVLATVTLALVFVVGRRLYGAKVALLASALLVLSPLYLFLGSEYMAHMATLCFLMAFAMLFIRPAAAGKSSAQGAVWWVHLVTAGLMLGMAFITRQLDAIVFAAPAVLLAYGRDIVHRIRPLLYLALGGIVPVSANFLYNAILTGNPLRSPYTLWWSFDHLGFGQSVGPERFTVAHAFWNMSFNLQSLETNLFGWPFFFALAFAAIPFLVNRAGRWDVILGVSTLSVMVGYLFYYGYGAPMPRYYFAAFPWLALLTARGAQELCRWPARVRHSRFDRPAARRAFPLALLALLIAYDISVYLPAQTLLYQEYGGIGTELIDAVKQADIHHAVIFVADGPPDPGLRYNWQVYPMAFSSNSPLLNTDVIYARDLGAQDRELMREFPGRRYYRLSRVHLDQAYYPQLRQFPSVDPAGLVVDRLTPLHA